MLAVQVCLLTARNVAALERKVAAVLAFPELHEERVLGQPEPAVSEKRFQLLSVASFRVAFNHCLKAVDVGEVVSLEGTVDVLY